MQKRRRFPCIIATLGLATIAVSTYTLGYARGASESEFVDNSPIIAVPSDYFHNVTPVPHIDGGRFSFDTFVFTDDQGRRMAMPVVAKPDGYWTDQMKLIAQQ